ncbi:MAG: PRC-barrel domain-containing protein [Verrucomicrobia bacterium]|nr:PRC-barrel domain-containing protein [Verrucomicrobiota bacterium]
MFNPSTDSPKPTGEPGYVPERLGYMKRATDLIGKRVKGKDGSNLGKLEDIALDPLTGKIALALVSSKSDASGALVPPGNFVLSPGKESWVKSDKKTFPKAQQYPKANWAGSIDTARLSEALQFFSLPTEGAQAKSGQMTSGTSLIGPRLAGKASAALGVVEDLMIDLPGGRVVFLVIKPANPPDPNYMYLVPPFAVRVAGGGNALNLDISADDFVKGPHFDKQFWVESSTKELAASVYNYYAPPGSKPGPAGANPPPQGAPATAPSSERELKKAVLAQILQDSSVSLAAEDTLSVSTVNGLLTLTGKVKSQEQRQAIGAAAERVAGAGKVDNQLEVRPPN